MSADQIPSSAGFNEGQFILEQQLISGLIANRETTERWDKRKKEHEELKNNLKFYSSKMKHRVFAPLGKKAMIKADLIHTNEITVSIGVGWFVKVSASDAIEICERRIKECDEVLKKCHSERQLLESRKDPKLRSEAFGGEEIIEKFDETEEEKWRKEHKDKIKKHKKQLAEVKQKLMESSSKTEEELWKHLDMLELQEELEDELARMEEDGDGDEEDNDVNEDDYETDDDSAAEDDIVPTNREKKRVTWAQGDDLEPVTEVVEPPLPNDHPKEIVRTTAIKDEIIETAAISAASETKSSRPVSKFKKSRKGAE